jgi:hypothetical protein
LDSQGIDIYNFEFTDDENLLIEYGIALAKDPRHIPAELLDRLQERYNEDEFVVITAQGLMMLANNYFNDIAGVEHSLRYLTDDEYWGHKTLVFDITEASADCACRIMNGWWSARYDDNKDVQLKAGLWELPLTDDIAKDCARGNGGAGKDLDVMVTAGSCTIKSIYWEE